MPELPEIETVKLQLSKVLVGQKCIKSDFKEINGKTVKEIKRLGKCLLINFGPNLDLGFHFKMTGQLIYDDGKKRIAGGHPSEDFVAKLPNKHTRAVFEFTSPSVPLLNSGEGRRNMLYFNDMRKFGWIKINPKFVDTLGEDALTIPTLKKSNKPIKLAIMDQTLIAGVGNIYANDALWEAGIDPRVPSNKVPSDKAELLLEKIKLVLKEGIKYGGASMSDYVDAHGFGGTYQNHFRVYKRDNLPCLRCKEIIKKISLGGRGTYYCPVCQV